MVAVKQRSRVCGAANTGACHADVMGGAALAGVGRCGNCSRPDANGMHVATRGKPFLSIGLFRLPWRRAGSRGSRHGDAVRSSAFRSSAVPGYPPLNLERAACKRTVANASMMRAAVLASVLVAVRLHRQSAAGRCDVQDRYARRQRVRVRRCSDGGRCLRHVLDGLREGLPARRRGARVVVCTNIFLRAEGRSGSGRACLTPSDAVRHHRERLGAVLQRSGPGGIVANNSQEGYGAIVAEQANGVVVDFISLQVVKPATITIYDATATGTQVQR